MTDATPESLYRQAEALLEQNPDSPEAFALLQRAARQGHAESAFLVGAIMLEHQNPDHPAIISWLEIAASQGHPYATYNILRLREMDGVSFDRHLAVYTNLAENGMTAAQLNLLEYYYDRNDPQAVYWAQKTAAQGHPFGQYILASHFQFSGEPDLERARNLYHEAAEKGLGVAHWQLGQIYRYGIGTPVDLTCAAQHLTPAAEQGIIAAQVMLADVLAKQGNPEALQWYRAAADNDDDGAKAELAQHYLTGRLTERDPLAAAKLAKEAAEYGHPEALRLMGDLYRYGLGLKADAATAQEYYRHAAENGSLAACQKLLSDAALHDPQHYALLKETALQRQNIENAYQTALALQEGRGRSIDYDRARKLFLEAAEFQHIGAATRLGLMYRYGQGVKISPRQAAYWFELAAAQGNATAQYHLARQYYYGQGVPYNLTLACFWLQAAIINGYENPETFKHLLAKWQHERANPQLEKPFERPVPQPAPPQPGERRAIKTAAPKTNGNTAKPKAAKPIQRLDSYKMRDSISASPSQVVYYKTY
ncbi:tetratricopeptide repeat protein [Neisseria chenwenguii]|uniref:Uncharacterized protein n=1 Tax=Neisseria chenwenguii TaxID=1853278 RepID=A0A220S4R7_9NEIS|nr:tetratricopeptide repeat protein [Neisseria chenwenguii]ASK28416.1 hypothetical protein BG910_02705 [Neisseria chenwenguii]ROV56864.1 sel1 repeat family protein [Neisseria chenwenguii]